MKLFNITFTVLFILFAALQYNDPDPYLWIPIYLASAFLCYQTFKGKFNKFSHWIIIAFCTVYAIRLFIDKEGVLSWFNNHEAESLVQTMKATKPWIEETREFGGLLIILIVSCINLIAHKKAGAN
ncbi:MAG: hypothetical protein RLY11_487 [Bacteroidota bacterium]|jgi:Transmembrane family 220, helix|nr:hypothetical protein [Chitinophagia bacterium]